jgi:hypothetical protein
MTVMEVGLLVVAEERTIVNVDTLYILQTAHVLERHVELFGLREEVWAGR